MELQSSSTKFSIPIRKKCKVTIKTENCVYKKIQRVKARVTQGTARLKGKE
jgi:hypothetical protein